MALKSLSDSGRTTISNWFIQLKYISSKVWIAYTDISCKRSRYHSDFSRWCSLAAWLRSSSNNSGLPSNAKSLPGADPSHIPYYPTARRLLRDGGSYPAFPVYIKAWLFFNNSFARWYSFEVESYRPPLIIASGIQSNLPMNYAPEPPPCRSVRRPAPVGFYHFPLQTKEYSPVG